jgi:hypothetical protein
MGAEEAGSAERTVGRQAVERTKEDVAEDAAEDVSGVAAKSGESRG